MKSQLLAHIFDKRKLEEWVDLKIMTGSICVKRHLLLLIETYRLAFLFLAVTLNKFLLIFFEFFDKIFKVLERFVNVMNSLSPGDHRERCSYGELEVCRPRHSSGHNLNTSADMIRLD